VDAICRCSNRLLNRYICTTNVDVPFFIICLFYSFSFAQVYTGDTTLSGLLQYDSNAFIFRSHTLIIEMTYLDGEKAKAEKYGHVHIEDIVENAHLFYEVEHLVFVHLSQKYSLRYSHVNILSFHFFCGTALGI